MIEQIKLLQGNPVFMGIMSAGILGSLAYMGRSSVTWAAQKLKRTFTSSVTLNSYDSPALFSEIASFIFTLPTFSKIKTLNILEKDRYAMSSNSDEKSFAASPSSGLYWGIYKRRIVFVEVEKEKNENGGETMGITFGAFSRTDKFLKSVIEQIIDKIQDKDLVKVTLGNSYFTRKKRSMDSIFLEGDLKEKILRRVDKFFASEEEHHKAGAPYTHKILFHGKPGTGKSSLIFALASHYDLKLKIITSDMDERQVKSLMAECNPRTLISIEDVDVSQFSVSREQDKDKIPLSALLGWLDSILSPEGCIICLSTNHVNTLDPALTRPGRINQMIELKYFSREFAKEIACKFGYNDLPSEYAEEEICPAKLLSDISIK